MRGGLVITAAAGRPTAEEAMSGRPINLGPFCSSCGGDRGPRVPADSDGLGCLENIYHTEELKR